MKTLGRPIGFEGLRKEVDRLFERLWEPGYLDLPVATEWMPTMDLSETPDLVTVRFEVPGVDPKDMHITLHEQVLTVRGEKKQEKEQREERFYKVERSYGSFVRSLRLPASVDPKKVNAAFKNGLLTIEVGKVAGADGTTIPIKADLA